MASSNDKEPGNSPPDGTGGGAGQTPAWDKPDIVMSAPAGIAMVTPQSASLNASTTTSIAAGQDINLLAQANAGYSVKMGISLFTYGKASNPKKPNQEASLSLHSASGKVSSQSQSDKTQVTADKAITVTSTTADVQIQAPKHVLLTAQGAYIKMSGGNIEVHAPGKVNFKAAMKSWTSGKSDHNLLKLPSPILLKKSVNALYWTYGPKFEKLNALSKYSTDLNLHAKTTGYALGESVNLEVEFSKQGQGDGNTKTVQLSGTVDNNNEVVIPNVFKSKELNIGWRI